MNALVGFRVNASGALSTTPAKRAEAARAVCANARAKAQAEAGALKANPAQKSGEATREVDTELDRDAFLQLLVLQMRHQDPMDPTDNAEMLAQLAQFAALEQMSSLNEGFERFSGNLDQLNFISAGGLLGREVSGVGLDGQLVEGTVEKVQLNGSVVYLTVDGTLMSMAGVLGIEGLNESK